MTEPAPQKSPHRRCETDPDHVAWEQRSVPAVEAWERWRSCLPTWRRILWVFCSHALHSSYSLMDTALQPDACLRAHPRNCLSSLRSVVFCSPGCRSHGPVCSWPGGGRGGEERADSNSVTEACLVSPTDELSCFRWAFISRSDSVFTTFDTRLVWFPDLFRCLSCYEMSLWRMVWWCSDCVANRFIHSK